MKRLIALATTVAALAGATPAGAAEVERADFRYSRALVAAGGGPLVVEPDGALFEHSAPGFSDLRVLDADGRQVPWRPLPVDRGTSSRRVRVLNSGTEGREAVALLDLGGSGRVHDRVELQIPERDFIGRVFVLGADSREGPFRQLSGTGVYDIRGGAKPARSTSVVFPPTDFRYLQLRATGIERIAGATVSGQSSRPRQVPRPPKSVARSEHGSRTVIALDLGSEVPVDELRVASSTERYERAVRILGSSDGESFAPLAAARIFRFAGSRSVPVALGARHRHLQIVVENGDDPPLANLEVTAWSRSHALLIKGGHRRPYTLWYGDPDGVAPSYDFARLPAAALRAERAAEAELGPEQANPGFEPPTDTRSFAARHPEAVTAALAIAALVLGGVGLFALRSRAPRRTGAPPSR